jgi:uncharacterized protein YndB with AHSA1/START domain
MPTTSATRVIEAPQEKVWAVLSDIANARRWNSAWSKIDFTSNQTHGPKTRFRAETEDGSAYEFVISAWVAPEYIEFTPIREETERYGVMLEAQAFHLRPEGADATRVDLISRSSTHGPRGWLVGLLFWRGYQKQGLNTALETLSSVFENDKRDGQTEEASPAAD